MDRPPLPRQSKPFLELLDSDIWRRRIAAAAWKVLGRSFDDAKLAAYALLAEKNNRRWKPNAVITAKCARAMTAVAVDLFWEEVETAIDAFDYMIEKLEVPA